MSDGLNNWYDKIPLKFQDFNEDDFSKLNIRAVPQSIVRFGAYVAPKSILMPCYINIGAYVDEGSTIDTFSQLVAVLKLEKMYTSVVVLASAAYWSLYRRTQQS